jgi:hypothetical protein
MASVRALLASDVLPGPSDFKTRFSTLRVHVTRVRGENIWILYRFDGERLYVMSARGEPPVPVDG